MAFNDGEPLDAAKLGALESLVNDVKSKLPTGISTGTTVNLNNKTTTGSTAVGVSNVYTGFPVTGWATISGVTTKIKQPVNIAHGCPTKPKGIIVTANISSASASTGGLVTANVLASSVTETTFDVALAISYNSSTTTPLKSCSVTLHWIAIY